MPVALHRDIRRTLEGAVRAARKAAEEGARTALRELGVADARAPSWLKEDRRELRVRLRAHARTLGDLLDTSDPARMPRLVREIAYAHWHRALFARFLVENDLLVDVTASNAPVRREDLTEIAHDEGREFAEVAAEFAAPMLPQIFPSDDPVLALPLPPETRQRLAALVDGLPAQIFKADDALGWTYQFWQADRKEECDEAVKSGSKIGADELPAVTQLFTEDYMVLFLLENTLGAWWAGKQLALNEDLARDAADEDEIRRKLSPDGYEWRYLRFLREEGVWRPAAGTFPDWPQKAAEITVLDPCMGSGHFLVFALDILAAMRKAEEGLDEPTAVTAVLRDNLHGLEIDPRCTQIAAFALALAAWKRLGGVRALPEMHLACSGLAIGMGKAEFIRLAEKIAEAEGFAGGRGDLLGRERNPMEERALARRRGGLERLYDLFAQAPELGSLIDPRRALGDFGTLYEEGIDGLADVIGKVLVRTEDDPSVREAAVVANGLAKAADLLLRRFTLISTNVPYLGSPKQCEGLKRYIESNHPESAADLSATFIARAVSMLISGGSAAFVTPQTLLSLKAYESFRRDLMSENHLNAVVWLGKNAFQEMNWWAAITSMFVLTRNLKSAGNYAGMDTDSVHKQEEKALLLKIGRVECVPRAVLNTVSLCRIYPFPQKANEMLAQQATSSEGLSSGDTNRFIRNMWEQSFGSKWVPFIGSVNRTELYGGRHQSLEWDSGEGVMANHPGSFIKGASVWGSRGIRITQLNSLAATIYTGELFDKNASTIVFGHDDDILPFYCYVESGEYAREVRKIEQKAYVVVRTLLEVPYDRDRWAKIAAEKFPNGLPKPYSNDPTQWLFDGHPRGSADPNALDDEGKAPRPGLASHPLQVAVVRLLGCRWPRQTGSSFMDCSAIAEPDEIECAGVVDNDGIVCLPALHGEAGAAERLRGVLRAAWGTDWGEGVVHSCLEAEGSDRDLETWLADEFFDGHCKLFHQTPFIWHVWDGLRGGFSALVNYHKLCASDGAGRRMLEKLRDTYLGEWISAQRRAVTGGDATAEDRLAAAEHLHNELTKIIDGMPPYDIFVRWKPLHEQPIGWEPDINDGVRLNIRPFLTAKPWRARGQKACILRVTPGVKKHAGADRGGEPHRDKEDYPWFWAEEHDVSTEDFAGGQKFQGRRFNDFHYTRAFKQAARDRKAKADGKETEAAQ